MGKNEYTYKVLPFFMLGIVIIPGEKVPLRIFESRYKQLIKDCKSDSSTFGIPFVKNGKIQNFGTEVRLHRVVATYPSGEMVIIVEGLSIFRRLSFIEKMDDKLYSGGMVQTLDRDHESTDMILLDLMEEAGIDRNEVMNSEQDAFINLDKLVLKLELFSDDRYQYISMDRLRNKEKFLSGFLRIEKSIRNQAHKLSDHLQSN